MDSRARGEYVELLWHEDSRWKDVAAPWRCRGVDGRGDMKTLLVCALSNVCRCARFKLFAALGFITAGFSCGGASTTFELSARKNDDAASIRRCTAALSIDRRCWRRHALSLFLSAMVGWWSAAAGLRVDDTGD